MMMCYSLLVGTTIGLRDLRHHTRESMELARDGMVTVTDHSQVAGYILAPLQFWKSSTAAVMTSPRLRAIVERVDAGVHHDAGTWEYVQEQRRADIDLESEW